MSVFLHFAREAGKSEAGAARQHAGSQTKLWFSWSENFFGRDTGSEINTRNGS